MIHAELLILLKNPFARGGLNQSRVEIDAEIGSIITPPVPRVNIDEDSAPTNFILGKIICVWAELEW